MHNMDIWVSAVIISKKLKFMKQNNICASYVQ